MRRLGSTDGREGETGAQEATQGLTFRPASTTSSWKGIRSAAGELPGRAQASVDREIML